MKFKFAAGMMGWSMLTNLIIVMGPYYYLPPEGDPLPPLIPNIIWFGVVNLLMILVSAGRVVDAFFDPFIAHFSDGFKGRVGRRVPFLRFFSIPASVFCWLVFFPPDASVSVSNAWWLGIALIFFFTSATGFVIPLNALIPEVAETQGQKLELSVFAQLGFVLGIIVAALSNNFASWAVELGMTSDPVIALRYACLFICVLAGILMLIPAYGLNENALVKNRQHSEPLWPALKKALAIPRFRYYIVADLCFHTALSLISTGLVYYLTVLAGEEKEMGGVLMGMMVIGSLFFFPVVRTLSMQWGRKKTMMLGLAIMVIVFPLLSLLGILPGNQRHWMYFIVLTASFPVAALGIVPIALLADIAGNEGKGAEGLFFAVKYFFVKVGQTIGIGTFALLTSYGIDPGNDLGLRMNGYVGAGLCLAGLWIFRKFRE